MEKLEDLAQGIEIAPDDWSQLALHRTMPEIDTDRMERYRLQRVREQLKRAGVAVGVFVSPVSLRYAIGYRNYALFQSHIPSAYLFVPAEGPVVVHGILGDPPKLVDEVRPAQAIAPFNGGSEMANRSKLLALDIKKYLSELGTDNRRIALEYVNPSLTRAVMDQGLDPIDAADLIEDARGIKSEDEINCIRWAIAVADLGIDKMKQIMRPGITELQLWALLNYTNLANNGDWHDGRMLASGDRINPWYQEASERKLEAGDLVGFDTDMVGPSGYCADVSRTFFCGPGRPTNRQKYLYNQAVEEIDYNLRLVRHGITLEDFGRQAFVQPEEFHANQYTCIFHGVGMCDEAPKLYYPKDRAEKAYPAVLQENMVICLESYVGGIGERDGVKLEQQVLVTKDGYELLSTYPLEETLLD
ncbi:Xaa-Pro peptidase family protein [Paracoccaceae bacterium]|nr:Xaa-Pro peptidase family protein [Paracoccaceae bacterium]